MRVAIIPTDPRAGVTVTALGLSMALAYKQSKTVRICYTGENPAIKRYVGKDEADVDKTRSISQVSKLLQAHAISVEEISNYCVKFGPNLELLDSWSEVLTQSEMEEILNFVYERSMSDYTICDVGYDLDDPLTRSVVKNSDVVAMVSDTSWASLTSVKEMMASNEPLFREKKVVLVVNRYDPAIAPLKWCAQTAGFAMRNTCKLHYNPYIEKGCNTQDLQSVILRAFESDPRVIELRQDLKELTQYLMSINSEKMRWED